MTLIPFAGLAQDCLQREDRTSPSPGCEPLARLPTTALADPPFDGDCDGDLDLRDIEAFQRRFSPGVPAGAECARFDRLGSEGVDLSDFAVLTGELTVPMPPP